MIDAREVAHESLSHHGLTAGPVVGVLVLLTLAAVVVVLALAYMLHLRDRGE